MPYVKHSLAFRAEAVALAAVLGLSAAAEQLGIEEKTIKSWLLKVGRDPADAIKPASWSRLADMALTKAERLVAEGKLSPAQLANLATMAEERAVKTEDRRKATEPESWSERFDAWCDTQPYPALARGVPAAVLRYILRTSDVPSSDDDTPTDHDATLRWACDLVAAVGDLETFHAEYRRWDAEHLHEHRTIHARARVLASEGLRFHEALSMARDLSADVAPTPPAWAQEAA